MEDFSIEKLRKVDRFDKYMAFKGLNDNKVTKELGLSIGTLSKSRKTNRDLSSKNIEMILNFYSDLNRIWLLAGEGTMLKNNAQIGDITNSTIVGANVNGNGNKITHYASEYDACRKEVAHLKELLAEKEKQILDKERIIELLSHK